jgi:hypothetical protein
VIGSGSSSGGLIFSKGTHVLYYCGVTPILFSVGTVGCCPKGKSIYPSQELVTFTESSDSSRDQLS